jgi:hypothetical protein
LINKQHLIKYGPKKSNHNLGTRLHIGVAAFRIWLDESLE